MENRHTLRVALLFNGTVFREETYSATSDPVISVGAEPRNSFSVGAPRLGERLEMFERTGAGYRIRFPGDLTGEIHIGDRTHRLEELADRGVVGGAGIKSGPDGDVEVYETTLGRGDWAIVELGEAQLYVQVMGRPARIAGRGFGDVDKSLVGIVGMAAVAHLAFLLVCFLAYNVDAQLKQRIVLDRFGEAFVDGVEAPEEKEMEQPSETTSGKRAGGEEGKVGEPDTKQETRVPKRDGPMEEKVDVSNMGAVKALDAETLGGGAMKDLMTDQEGFSRKLSVAMGGDDAEFRAGRGTNGMSIRGDGSGGGGDGPGRMKALGGVDTGGGPGPGAGARLQETERTEVKPVVDGGAVTSGDFCKRENIRRVVSAKIKAIKYCYERQLQTEPSLKGKLIAQWKIGLDGSVESTSVASSTVGSPAVESCVLRVIKRMRFEKPAGGICVIQYPFMFRNE